MDMYFVTRMVVCGKILRMVSKQTECLLVTHFSSMASYVIHLAMSKFRKHEKIFANLPRANYLRIFANCNSSELKQKLCNCFSLICQTVFHKGLN